MYQKLKRLKEMPTVTYQYNWQLNKKQHVTKAKKPI